MDVSTIGSRDMARRMDWEKHRHDGGSKLTITDEVEYRSQDRAARWLNKVEPKVAEKIQQMQVKREWPWK
jgi:hypothetical protein